MKEITFIAFNYGNAGRYFNGPGVCLYNFIKKLKALNIKINIYTEKPTTLSGVKSIFNWGELQEAIKRSDLVHHWSGIGLPYIKPLEFARKVNVKTVSGPNVLDLVKETEEKNFLKQVHPDYYLTVNQRLKYLLSKERQIPLEKMDLLLVGPDEELWFPINERNDEILWKGNSHQYVKDIQFGLSVARALPQYRFRFLGYPEPYDYFTHINSAKSCYLYFSTSLSETMGLGLLESWMSGLPSITHPKIYLHGQNYQTGIITNREIASYCDAIKEIMENPTLHQNLSQGAKEYVKNNFADVAKNYLENYK